MPKYFFQPGKRYKVRFQFSNSIVLYAYMFAYKDRHAHIINVVDDFMQNLFDSEQLKMQYLNDSNKKVTIKFSLKGATPAINITTSRAEDYLKAAQKKENISN